MTLPLLELEHLSVSFAAGRSADGVKRRVHAVRDVSLSLAPGRTLALVGESGCGKSTLARAALQLVPSDTGRVCFDGVDLGQLSRAKLRALRPRMQMVFQDPLSSLNPRLNVVSLVGEAMLAHARCTRADLRERVSEVLEQVGLSAAHLDRYPHEFSGGQRQRIGIARAVALNPELVVCDEAVAALDVSVQAQVLNLLRELQQQRGLAYLFISHDLAVVRHVAHIVAVMYLGQVVEYGPATEVLTRAQHPYTRALLACSTEVDGDAADSYLHGEVPSPLAPPAGCAFHPRCPAATALCACEAPPDHATATGVRVRCHFPGVGV
jgi:oligopeptide transport system ATP-binding protein